MQSLERGKLNFCNNLTDLFSNCFDFLSLTFEFDYRSQGCSNYLKSLIEHLLAYLSLLYSLTITPWIYRNVAQLPAPSKKCCLTVDCAAGSVSTLQSWHRYIQHSPAHTCRTNPWLLRRPSHHYHHYRDQGARKRVKSWLLLLAWCEKCPLQPISSGAMSYPPGQASLLGRAGRFIEKNDYLFCGSWLPYLFSHNTPPPRSLWDLLRDSFLPFIYLSLLNIEILQTHRQESGVWSLCLMVEIVKSSTKFWQISLYYLRLEWLLP